MVEVQVILSSYSIEQIERKKCLRYLQFRSCGVKCRFVKYFRSASAALTSDPRPMLASLIIFIWIQILKLGVQVPDRRITCWIVSRTFLFLISSKSLMRSNCHRNTIEGNTLFRSGEIYEKWE